MRYRKSEGSTEPACEGRTKAALSHEFQNIAGERRSATREQYMGNVPGSDLLKLVEVKDPLKEAVFAEELKSENGSRALPALRAVGERGDADVQVVPRNFSLGHYGSFLHAGKLTAG